VVQEVLEAEMTEAIGAEKGERTVQRLGYRSGYYERKLVTRVGVLELRVPQDRAGRFSTELFERYQRSEKALVSALVEMYVQGVSTRNHAARGKERRQLHGGEGRPQPVLALHRRRDDQPHRRGDADQRMVPVGEGERRGGHDRSERGRAD
jgi:hypothetical protein